MGQELNTKVALVVAKVLGIPMAQIRVESSNSQRVGNASPTAASTGSDINGNAARIAATQIKERLTPLALKLLAQEHGIIVSEEELIWQGGMIYSTHESGKQISFGELVRYAYNERVPLGALATIAPPICISTAKREWAIPSTTSCMAVPSRGCRWTS